MGGKALQNYGVFTERKNSEEFNWIGLEIQSQFYNDFNNLLETEIVTCYHEKKDHGDLDLLLKIDHVFHNNNINLRDYIKNTFKPKAIHNNGGVFSFDYKNFQIDFIPVKESNWEVAKTYFSYDPLGNAMGKTFHKLNLSYGWDGLKYKYRNFNGKNSHDITITKNPKKIFEFGGYDYKRYLEGFNEIEEIFDFIINGKYFNSEIFKMENLNHVDKKRNKKRKSYHQFLEYIEKNDITKNYVFEKNKSIYLNDIDNYFPEAELLKKLDILNEKNEINCQVNKKFNGRIIKNLIPQLKDKILGNFIREFKEDLGDSYKEIILNLSSNEIELKIKSFYNKFYV